jgi:excisionase family DNA binding protein
MENALTVVQLAQLLNISQGTIRNMIKEEDPAKRIPYVRIGKNYRFFPSEIAQFFNINPKTLNVKE